MMTIMLGAASLAKQAWLAQCICNTASRVRGSSFAFQPLLQFLQQYTSCFGLLTAAAHLALLKCSRPGNALGSQPNAAAAAAPAAVVMTAAAAAAAAAVEPGVVQWV
jgi:hypothetical protein